MNSYNKVVRNKVPQILQKSGVSFNFEVLSKDRSVEYLYSILISYIYDSVETKSLSEIVECIDLLTSIASEYGYSEEDILSEKNRITEEKGSYSEKILLKNTY